MKKGRPKFTKRPFEEVNSALPEWIERLKKERENALSL